jgi:GrpB-like predicted nucleotidyltransferase (UPF0157 family)
VQADSQLLVNYSPAWPDAFAEEETRLASVLNGSRIEHIGSTAIAGLPARPIIDILVSVDKLAGKDAYTKPLQSIGYYYVPSSCEAAILVFRKGELAESDLPVTLYIVQTESKECLRYLQFRDHLRTNERAREEYANLKQALASKFAHDLSAYEDSKTAFVMLVMCYVDAGK